MKSLTKDEIREVVRLVNGARKSAGLNSLGRLPKGYRDDERACPLARALPCRKVARDGIVFRSVSQARELAWEVWETRLLRDDKTRRLKPVVEMPRPIANFVRAFDAGKLPEFEAAG